MAVYIVTVPDADHKMQPVEVPLEIYQVFAESKRIEQRQRYERRMHLDSRSLEHCLHHRNAASEPLEETFERLEMTRNVWCALAQLSPKQQHRLILHFWSGYSYTEIAEMEHCNKATVMRSVKAGLKKFQKYFLKT